MAKVLASALEVLNDVFGYPSFRGHQAEVIGHVAAGDPARAQEAPS